jgi:hypothetical protein
VQNLLAGGKKRNGFFFYVLKESDMLPQMIGRKVTVTGTIEEKDRVKVLDVAEFEEVKEK